jgi:hypothetical protein
MSRPFAVRSQLPVGLDEADNKELRLEAGPDGQHDLVPLEV